MADGVPGPGAERELHGREASKRSDHQGGQHARAPCADRGVVALSARARRRARSSANGARDKPGWVIALADRAQLRLHKDSGDSSRTGSRPTRRSPRWPASSRLYLGGLSLKDATPKRDRRFAHLRSSQRKSNGQQLRRTDERRHGQEDARASYATRDLASRDSRS